MEQNTSMHFRRMLSRKVGVAKYQTRKTVFDHISKCGEESSTFDAQWSSFDEGRGAWKCG